MVGSEFPQLIVSKRAGYIARTTGSRSLPWRVMVIAKSDKALPNNDIIYRLASPSKVTDVSWIKPGKSTEEWIIASNLYRVPFRAIRWKSSLHREEVFWEEFKKQKSKAE